MKESTDYCRLWFHDVFEENGIPFSRKEIDLMRNLREISSSTRA